MALFTINRAGRRNGVALLALLIGMLSLACAPAHGACTLTKFAELPVTMSGPRALVSAKINGADVVFIADSGAFYSTISPGNAATLNLPLSPAPIARIIGIGGDATIKVGTVKSLVLAGAKIPNVEFIVGGSEMSTEAVGLLGQNVLHLADVEYDLSGGAIRFMSPHDCGKTDLAYWAHSRPYSTTQIEWGDRAHPHTIATVLVNGARVRAIFDTGAATSILSLDAARRAGIKTDSPGVKPIGLSGGVGRRLIQVWSAPVATFGVGDEKINNTRLIIGDISDIDADMLLGADFFLSHRIFVSNSQRRLYFTYEGGPVFDLKPKPAAATNVDGKAAGSAVGGLVGADVQAHDPQGAKAQDTKDASLVTPTPIDADGFSRRGAFFASRREYGKAIMDLTHARDLEPSNAQYAYELAVARVAADQPDLAKADLDAAIELKPDDAEALILRWRLRHDDHDVTGGVADLDAASRALPKPAHLRFTLAEAYIAADQYDRAVSEFSDWIDAHPDDSRRPLALNGRCFARALSGQALGKALSDCNAALWLMPGTANILDSRGLVRLRRGEFSRAISDYDAALKRNPKIAWSLYGRGLAELKTGEGDKGRGDIAEATALDPKLPERAGKLGLAPETLAATSASTPTSPIGH